MMALLCLCGDGGGWQWLQIKRVGSRWNLMKLGVSLSFTENRLQTRVTAVAAGDDGQRANERTAVIDELTERSTSIGNARSVPIAQNSVRLDWRSTVQMIPSPYRCWASSSSTAFEYFGLADSYFICIDWLMLVVSFCKRTTWTNLAGHSRRLCRFFAWT